MSFTTFWLSKRGVFRLTWNYNCVYAGRRWAGLSTADVAADLSVVGSLEGGGELGEVFLLVIPEPSASVLVGIALVFGIAGFRRRH